ncbi:MAG: hypothetical protein QXN93_01490 [Methanomassiliicoccales archaeon]
MAVPMISSALLRRIIHLATPAFLIYYFLPDPLWKGGIGRETALLLILFVVLVAEFLRLKYKPRIPGMRDYEQYQMSAAAWAAIGMTLAFLFFPLEYSAPVLMGMGWVDPLIGELRIRKSRTYPWVPIFVYFGIAGISLSYFEGVKFSVMLASIVATSLAIGIERLKLKLVDDDFLMIIVPLIGIYIVFALIQT